MTKFEQNFVSDPDLSLLHQSIPDNLIPKIEENITKIIQDEEMPPAEFEEWCQPNDLEVQIPDSFRSSPDQSLVNSKVKEKLNEDSIEL